ncbi:reverse transcriptase family protein [Pleionea sediminis]|uniref:reverse transcriptase family protein n=1 Tax=Pleionea sediminis TaxID=2569479 RepID=UPI001185DAE8|nr:reverse transcriptase family protein [Pleionea sediminis]
MSEISPGKLTRQQLYDRIRESSKDEYILEEMKRLGFWDESEQPPEAEELIKEKARLRKELNKLLRNKRLMDDPEKALELMHKERKKKALEKRKETKKERIKSAYERALNWFKLNQKEITYLGENTKIEISQTETNEQKLNQQNLPKFVESSELAEAMGLCLSELRFLTYTRDVSKVTHYQRFSLVKKSGGVRHISAPMPRLKRIQYWVKTNILDTLPLHDCAHGFVKERSIVSNAAPHIGQSIVINMDLKDFFPTITYKRVKGLFQQLGYNEKISILFALLTTEPHCDELSLDTETYYVAQGKRLLPQGAPTSPAIANLICRRLDRRISDCAKKLGFEYTRYADDLTFSIKDNDSDKVRKLLWRVKAIIKDEGFNLHPEKTRIMRSHQQQEVTGIVVNEKINLSRKKLKRLRATLFQIEKDGFSGKNWDDSKDILRSLTGFVNYYAMVDPAKSVKYKEQLKRIIQKHPYEISKTPFIGKLKKSVFIEKSKQGLSPWDDWWQPVEKTEPELILPKENEKQDSRRKATDSIESTSSSQSNRGSTRNRSSELPELIGKGFFTVTLIIIAVALAKVSPLILLLAGYLIYRLWK